MNGNIAHAAGLTVGITLGLVIAILLVRFANKNKKYKTEYDERQIRVRGDAYRFAFYTVVIYEAIMFVLETAEIALPVNGAVLHIAGVFLGCIVLCAYCIWKDAYWGLNNNRKSYGVIFVVCALLNLIPVIGAFADGSMIQDGMFSTPFINLIVCVMLLIIGVELLVKHIQEKRAEQPED